MKRLTKSRAPRRARHDLGRVLAAALLTALVLAASAVAPAAARVLIGVTLIEHDRAPAEIQRVRAGYPAAAAGLRPGDLVLEVNGAAPDGAEATARAITASGDEPVLLVLRRGGERVEATILPWATPDPERDAALFPYPAPEDAPIGTSLRARIAERDYDIVSPEAVFTLERAFGADQAMIGRRVAFRARAINCDAIAGAPPTLYPPNNSPLNEFRPAQSLLFDPRAAEAERARCEAYMRERGLDLSSPVVVVAGRFVLDEGRVFSSGGPVLLVDAVLFDNTHVSLGMQVIGFIDVLERIASAF